jgi:hypothetical protein
MSDNGAPLDRLESSLGADWSAIRKARSDATAMRNRLDELFRGQNSPDTSLAVFGSVARKEVTYRARVVFSEKWWAAMTWFTTSAAKMT